MANRNNIIGAAEHAQMRRHVEASNRMNDPDNDPVVKLWRQWLPLHVEAEARIEACRRLSNRYPSYITVNVPQPLYGGGWNAQTNIHRKSEIDALDCSEAQKKKFRAKLKKALAARKRSGVDKAWDEMNSYATPADRLADKILSRPAKTAAGWAAKIHVMAEDPDIYSNGVVDDGLQSLLKDIAPFAPPDMRKALKGGAS